MRAARIQSILKGVLFAVVATALGMVLTALIAVTAGLTDQAITVVNQALKALSIVLGVLACVGRGGQQGFLRGAVVGLLYMVVCYALYCALAGGMLPAGLIAGEFLIGAVIGSLAGAVAANLKPSRKKSRRAVKPAKPIKPTTAAT